MADINVRVGQSEAIKVLSTGGGGASLTVPKNVIGGIASITALHVSGLSTFVGVSTFHDQTYSQKSFSGLSFEGISGITTVGSLSGITTTPGDLYVGGKLNVSGDASVAFGRLNVTGILTANTVTTGEWETNIGGVPTDLFTGISLYPGSGGESGVATITSPNTLYISPRDIIGDIGEDGKTGKVVVQGDFQVTGSTISQSSQIIEIGDYRVAIASSVQDLTNLDGAGIGIGSTSPSGVPTAFSVYTAGISTGGTGYDATGTGVTALGGSGSYLFVDYISSGGVIGTVSVSAGSTARNYQINDNITIAGGDGNGVFTITATENSDYSQKLFTFDKDNSTLASNIGLGIGAVSYTHLTLPTKRIV